MAKIDNNLGCGEEFNMNTMSGFICGIADGNGHETFCLKCKMKLKRKWLEEDRTSEDPRIREIYKLKLNGRLNY